MDRALYLTHLEQTARHVAEQEHRIAELHRDGHDAAEAEDFLELFHETLDRHIAHRDRVLKALEQLDRWKVLPL